MRVIRLLIYFWWQVYKREVKPFLKPTMFISSLIAWLVTNGWSYILLATATGWLRTLAITYVSLLWMPFTPEKLITIPLAFYIQKKLFVELPKRLKIIRIREYQYSYILK